MNLTVETAFHILLKAKILKECIKVKSYEPSGPLLPELIPVSAA